MEASVKASKPSILVSPDAAFWVFAAAISIVVLDADTPLSLLTVYQAKWRFSTGVLTVIDGLYSVGISLAVFVVGRTSDGAARAIGLFAATLLFIAPVAVLAIIGLLWVAPLPPADDRATRPSSAPSK
jgi:hypothetical protein